jgi:hypothetical protein
MTPDAATSDRIGWWTPSAVAVQVLALMVMGPLVSTGAAWAPGRVRHHRTLTWAETTARSASGRYAPRSAHSRGPSRSRPRATDYNVPLAAVVTAVVNGVRALPVSQPTPHHACGDVFGSPDSRILSQ